MRDSGQVPDQQLSLNETPLREETYAHVSYSVVILLAGACKPAAWPRRAQGGCRTHLSVHCVDVGARRQQRLHDGPRQVRRGQVQRRRAAAVARLYIQAMPQEPAHLPTQQHPVLWSKAEGLMREALVRLRCRDTLTASCAWHMKLCV